MNQVPIIIPAYEPDDRLISLLEDLARHHISPVIVVNDGSGPKYNRIFQKAKVLVDKTGGTVIEYPANHGKGYALKKAFGYVLAHYANAIGVVTADCDGQHCISCIHEVQKALVNNPNALILGVRQFDGEDIPLKSRLGNQLTVKVLYFVTGLQVSDTQTGLRGIPCDFMEALLHVCYDRFEFETQMLLDSIHCRPIVEVPIKTIYDSKKNHQTHFNPFKDSLRIYLVLGRRFVKYALTALSSSLIDLILFTIFCYLFKGSYAYVAKATVLARIISAIYNYGMNYKVVFHSNANPGKAAVKYFLLALLQMSASAGVVSLLVWMWPRISELWIKAVTDTLLFFFSYYIQKSFVFTKKGKTCEKDL